MNEILKVKIDDLDMNSKGIAHHCGKTIFVDNALIGEEIECEILNQKNNLVIAKNKKILSVSPNRTTPLCPHYFVCGGCDTEHIKYEESLNFKKNQLKLTLKKITNLTLPDFEIEKSPEIYHYRNKIALKICKLNGKKVLCYYKKNSHETVEIKTCKIANSGFDCVIEKFNDFLKATQVSAYNEKTKHGVLKHMVARIINNNLLLTIVLKQNHKLDNLDKLYQDLSKSFDNVGINININNSDNQILSENFVDIVGTNFVEFFNFNLKLKITNASFLQVNTPVANEIYDFCSNLLSGTTVNSYSGAGLLSAIIAKKSKKNKVFGIEINKNATNIANILKHENNIDNLENLCGDSAKVLSKLNLKDFNLILDPPKSGIDKNMIETIKTFLPSKIIYISCNKISLAKNLNELKDFYEIKQLKAFDMFPQTINLETVCVLQKK